MKTKIIGISAFVFFVVLFLIAPATIYAANYGYIQDQIDHGSTNINLGTNIYTPEDVEYINVNKNNIVIKGQSANSKAILDAKDSNSRIMKISGNNIRLENLIFKNVDAKLYGGAITSEGANLTIINCEFINNKAIVGAIILNNDSTNTLIQNCIFNNNKAAYYDETGGGGGGAIDSHSSNGRIINCTFSNNSAINGGGALYFIFGTNNTVSGCTFKNNNAPIGGAIWTGTTITTLTVLSSIFNNNVATKNGGAIYITNTLNLLSSSFTGNNAKLYGGGIFTTGSAVNLIKNSKFTSNIAKYGGAVYNNGPLSIQSSTFKSNKANLYGGAIYANKNLNITGGTITTNSANYGSAVFNLATLRISKVSMNYNIAKIIGFYIKYPSSAKPSKKITINVFLKTGDNIIGSIYNKKGSTYINGIKKNIVTYTPSKTFSSTIGGLSKNIVSNSTGIATRSFTVGKNDKKVSVSASYSQNGQKWSISKSISVSKTTKAFITTARNTKSGSSKSTSTSSSSTVSSSSKNNGASVKVSFSNHEYSHLASLVNIDNYTISSKKISYWNLKSDKNLIGVVDYLYKVDKNGWYYGALNSKSGIDWKKLGGIPSISGTWFNLTVNSKEKYTIGKKISKYKNNTSNKVVMFFVSVKSSINHNSLTPYVSYNYNLVNKKDNSKKTVRFFEKADSNIYFTIDESSKSLKDYNKYLLNSKKAPTNNKNIISITRSIISKINGELTSTKKAEALFKWVRDYIAYPSKMYKDSVKMATGALSSRIANCVDQSSLLISMLRTTNIPARYEHYKPCTFSSGLIVGHVWVSLYVGGKWIEVDTTSKRNFFGKIVNVVKKGSKIGPYITVPF